MGNNGHCIAYRIVLSCLETNRNFSLAKVENAKSTTLVRQFSSNLSQKFTKCMRIPRLSAALSRTTLEQNWRLRTPHPISSISRSIHSSSSTNRSLDSKRYSRGVVAREKGIGARGVRLFTSAGARLDGYDDMTIPPTLSLANYKPKVRPSPLRSLPSRSN